MRENSKDRGFIRSIIKGFFTATIVTLIGVLVFAGIVKLAFLSTSVIKAVNQFIKVISVFLGCFFNVKENGGLIKGALIGCFSSLVTYLLFALIGGETQFGLSIIVDMIFMTVIGAISGIIAVNLKK